MTTSWGEIVAACAENDREALRRARVASIEPSRIELFYPPRSFYLRLVRRGLLDRLADTVRSMSGTRPDVVLIEDEPQSASLAEEVEAASRRTVAEAEAAAASNPSVLEFLHEVGGEILKINIPCARERR